MAVGRKQVEAVTGRAGRLSAPPAVQSGIFVRDPEAAEAIAIRQRVAAFESAGVKVPEELQARLDNIQVPKSASEVKLVDPLTGEEMAKVNLTDPGVDEFGQPLPPGGFAEDQLPSKEDEPLPEYALPDAVAGPTDQDLPEEVVRPNMHEGPGPRPAYRPPLPDQELESTEEAMGRLAEQRAPIDEALEEQGKVVEKVKAKAAKDEEKAQAKGERPADVTPQVKAQKQAEAAADAAEDTKAGPHTAKKPVQRGNAK